jgi:hypothetical protein
VCAVDGKQGPATSWIAMEGFYSKAEGVAKGPKKTATPDEDEDEE